jgi:intracellular sulfur oxidation DsrE/DsrF family protein
MPDAGSSDNSLDAGAARGLLVHSAGPADSAGISAALRSAANAVAALAAGVPVEVVVQGPGVSLLAAGSTQEKSVSEALAQGIRILACGNSLRSVGLEPGELSAGVGSVPAAIAHLATRQWEGWAYVRL